MFFPSSAILSLLLPLMSVHDWPQRGKAAYQSRIEATTASCLLGVVMSVQQHAELRRVTSAGNLLPHRELKCGEGPGTYNSVWTCWTWGHGGTQDKCDETWQNGHWKEKWSSYLNKQSFELCIIGSRHFKLYVIILFGNKGSMNIRVTAEESRTASFLRKNINKAEAKEGWEARDTAESI